MVLSSGIFYLDISFIRELRTFTSFGLISYGVLASLNVIHLSSLILFPIILFLRIIYVKPYDPNATWAPQYLLIFAWLSFQFIYAFCYCMVSHIIKSDEIQLLFLKQGALNIVIFVFPLLYIWSGSSRNTSYIVLVCCRFIINLCDFSILTLSFPYEPYILLPFIAGWINLVCGYATILMTAMQDQTPSIDLVHYIDNIYVSIPGLMIRLSIIKAASLDLPAWGMVGKSICVLYGELPIVQSALSVLYIRPYALAARPLVIYFIAGQLIQWSIKEVYYYYILAVLHVLSYVQMVLGPAVYPQ